jgi:hypothetical protein
MLDQIKTEQDRQNAIIAGWVQGGQSIRTNDIFADYIETHDLEFTGAFGLDASSGQSLNNDTWTAIQWEGARGNPNTQLSWSSESGVSSRIVPVLPTDNHIYMFCGSITFTNNSSGQRGVQIASDLDSIAAARLTANTGVGTNVPFASMYRSFSSYGYYTIKAL